MVVYKRELPLAITFIVGLIACLDYFTPGVGAVVTAFTHIKNWTIIIAAWALGLGAVNLFRVHTRHVSRRTAGQWYFSIWLLLMLVVFVIVGLVYWPQFETSANYDWLYWASFGPISATMYSSLCFYMTMGAYRVLRARNLDAALLLIAGFVVIMGNTPVFPAIWTGFYEARKWIFDVIIGGSYRGIRMGVGLGSVVMGIRTLLGFETGYLGRR